MSDPDRPHAAAELEQCLRRVVRLALKNDEEITVNKARSLAESELRLQAGFFKDTPEWKTRSKDIISAAVEDPVSPAKPNKAPPKSKTTTTAATTNGKRVAKRVKPAPVDSDDNVSNSAAEESKATAATQRGRKRQSEDTQPSKPSRKRAKVESDDDSSGDEIADTRTPAPPAPTDEPPPPTGDESDYSSVIDEPPPPPKGKRGKKAPSANKAPPRAKASKPARPPAAAAAAAADDEVKRLQGWLLKCGVRKLWHRELAGCATPADKTRHLKRLLADVGMAGRYSAEKAKQIKEARELAAELEAAKEFNDQWGDGGDDDDDDDDEQGDDHHDNDDDEEEEEVVVKPQAPSRPRRPLPKGLVDFGDSGDEEDD